MEESMYITKIIKIFKKYLWVIALLAILGGVAGKFLASSGPEPTFQSSGIVLIKQKFNESNIIINQADDTSRFINTAQTLISTPAILTPVKKELKLKEDLKELSGKINVSNENGSHLLRISVEESSADKATKIVNKTIEVFEKEIRNYLNVDTVQVVAYAQKGQESEIIHTRPNANIIMGVIIGMLLGTFLAFILSFISKPKEVKSI
jgi:capsular polysaccharide biosynthesis protein